MGEHASNAAARRRSYRPLGVWAFTLFYGLLAGWMLVWLFPELFPKPEALCQPGYTCEHFLLSPYFDQVGFPILLNLAIVVSVVGALIGNKLARNLMLALVTFDWGYRIFLIYLPWKNFVAAVGKNNIAANLLMSVGPVFLLLALTYWYFLGSRTRNFYSAA